MSQGPELINVSSAEKGDNAKREVVSCWAEGASLESVLEGVRKVQLSSPDERLAGECGCVSLGKRCVLSFFVFFGVIILSFISVWWLESYEEVGFIDGPLEF